MLILLIVLILVFGLGGGYYGHSYRDGNWVQGGSFGLGTILIILLILYVLGLLPALR